MPEDLTATVSVRGVPLPTAMRIFDAMTTSRALEDRLHALYRQSRIRGRLISGRGQEAISAGAVAALDEDEIITPLHRDLSAHLLKGTPPLSIVLHYFQRADGPSGGRDGDVHFGEWERGVFPMVSHLPDSWPIAVGIAHAGTLEGAPRAVMAFCGEGATSTGLWHETLNFASVFRTPNVFIVENNQFAYSTPTRRQYAIERLADRGAAYGIPGVQVDGNDALAVHVLAREAVARARSGEGPTLIEAMTMRMDGHAVHDGAEYVPRELLEEWRKRDPIPRLRADLVAAGVPEAELDEVGARAARAVDEAVEAAEAAAEPDPATVTEGVFARPVSA